MSSKSKYGLPECGILPTDGSIDSEEWRDAMIDRWEWLIGESAQILSSCDDALYAARKLNRLYAPFNVVDESGETVQHLVVTTGRYADPQSGGNRLHFQCHDLELDLQDPSDEYILHCHDGFWWFDDDDLPSDDPEIIHEKAAWSCLRLVWWGNEEEIAGVAGEIDS